MVNPIREDPRRFREGKRLATLFYNQSLAAPFHAIVILRPDWNADECNGDY